jgi:hypothetical protein
MAGLADAHEASSTATESTPGANPVPRLESMLMNIIRERR